MATKTARYGVLTLATPNDYLKAIGLALSMRVSNPDVPTAIACSPKIRHLVAPYFDHVIDEKPQLHHIAFEVLDWAEIHKAVDYLAHNKVHLVWGPGRHVIGHNVATYHRNVDLVRVEIFTEMDQMKDEDLGYFDPRPWHQEFPLYPKMHGPETLRNYWGFGSERVIQGYQTNELPKYEAIRG